MTTPNPTTTVKELQRIEEIFGQPVIPLCAPDGNGGCRCRTHQPELSCLVDNARQHKFDLVLVWSLDRLSRDGALAILELVHKLNIYGVRVISYQESWTEAPGEIGEILYAITGWVAKMESERRSERTKAGPAGGQQG